MLKKQKKRYHYIYKVTCLVNGCYYYGMHSTYNLNDGYMGSGNLIRQSIFRHGKENHSIEILEYFDDRASLAKREAEVVNEDLLKDKLCLNLVLGGANKPTENKRKFFTSQIQKERQKRGQEKMKWLSENDPTWLEKRKQKASVASKKQAEAGLNPFHTGELWKGRSHRDETREKMRSTHQKKENHKGEKNSQFGSVWVYHLEQKVSKKIKKEELQNYIDNGWIQGRKMNFETSNP